MPILRTRLEAAQEAIVAYFAARSDVYVHADLAAVLRDHRRAWDLTKNTTVADFLNFLQTHGRLRHLEIRSAPPYHETVHRYTWGDASALRVATEIRRGSYLCHGTAVELHGLATLSDRTIYVNDEQSSKLNRGSLTQEGIRQAFSRPQRTSKLSFAFKDARVVIVNGKHTDRLGAVDLPGPAGEKLRCASLERTLIDIAVRPSYAGGIVRVAEAYKNALNRISVDRLCALLETLSYTYPYHQAIGFLMQHAGYPPHAYKLLLKMPIEFDFYLQHNLSDPAYNTDWKIYVPRELDL
jgi:hypothetical protein